MAWRITLAPKAAKGKAKGKEGKAKPKAQGIADAQEDGKDDKDEGEALEKLQLSAGVQQVKMPFVYMHRSGSAKNPTEKLVCKNVPINVYYLEVTGGFYHRGLGGAFPPPSRSVPPSRGVVCSLRSVSVALSRPLCLSVCVSVEAPRARSSQSSRGFLGSRR